MSGDGTGKKALEATLAFAALSGAWIVEGVARPFPKPEEPPSDLPIFSAPDEGELTAIIEEIGDCGRCRLHHGRTHIVFGVGDPHARIMFIGEGPGEEEDRRGEPFVGRAGQLLDRMIRAIGLTRREVYIANAVKCRPPKNRDPAADEVEACSPFLAAQIKAVNPAVICALGAHAAKLVTKSDSPIGKLRGRVIEIEGRAIVATYHPAYLLRNPEAKRQAWQDLKLVRDRAGIVVKS